MTTLTVAVFNATGGSNKTNVGAFGTWWDDLGADAAIVSEAFQFAPTLRCLGHLRMGRGSHGALDVATITKRRPLRSKTTQVTKFIPRPQPKPLLWHDRHITRTVVGPLNPLVLVSSHAPAVIQGHDRLLDNAGAREWRDHGLPTTEALLRRDMERNRALVHGGDLNQRVGPGPENPAEMYERLGMKWRNNGVMWFAWNPDRFALASGEWLPTPPGSDGHKTGLFVLRRKESR